MELLVIGGTRFLGRHVVENALLREHQVTLFNRGLSNPGLFAQQGVEEIHGDRDGDILRLTGRRWDAVVDANGYVPRVVRMAAELLSGNVDRYLFISSISVYADPLQPASDEGAALETLEDADDEEITSQTYGGLKALCERAVQEVYGSDALIIRPGLVVGPYDYTDRFTYWPMRVARGGRILAPGDSSTPIQFIDARDLASWMLDLIESGNRGAFNATGPAERLTMQRFLHTCLQVAGSEATLEWVDEEFLLGHGVRPSTDLPLWIPGESGEAYGTIQIARAIVEGLTFLPLEQTIADTLQWATQREAQHEWRAGLSAQREQELLTTWERRQDKAG